jgi:spore coat polysaccharide biosynthesis protein SpsF
MRTVVSVQARMGSSRLPGKVLLPLTDKPVLGWVVDRCSAATSVDEVVVAVGDDPPNRAVEEWCRRNDVRSVVGPEDDLLERHRAVCEATDATTLVRITGDSPLVPPGEIDRLVRTHRTQGAEYTTNHTGETPHGMIVDVVEVDVLSTLANRGESHPTASLRDRSEQFATRFSADPRWEAIADADLEVDTPEDYWRLTDAVEAVGPDALAVGRWLLGREAE